MSVNGTVVAAVGGLTGFDTQIGLTDADARFFANQGMKFCIRYVSRDDAGRAFHQTNGTPDLSFDETASILAAGMALMVVQHVTPGDGGWVITPGLGKSYGANAARFASAGGLSPGATVWLDLENVKEGTPTEDIIGYCNDWFASVTAGGYDPGVYLGFNIWLSPDDLFFKLSTHCYWRALGNIPDVSHRGFQLKQGPASTLNGVSFEYDVSLVDDLGGTPMWMTSQP